MPNVERRVNEIIEAPEIFQAYPQLKKVSFGLRESIEDGEGEYNPYWNNICISLKAEVDSATRTLIHEVQHVIQNIEGFASGANRTIVEEGELKPYADELTARRIENARKKFGSSTAESLHDFIREKSVYEIYKRTAGEVEARNAQTRANMTAEERAATPISETEDVARDEQLIIQMGSVSASMNQSRFSTASIPHEYTYKGITERGEIRAVAIPRGVFNEKATLKEMIAVGLTSIKDAGAKETEYGLMLNIPAFRAIIIGKNGVKHGLRPYSQYADVYNKTNADLLYVIGDVLKNSIPVNERIPDKTEKKEIENYTILLGCAIDTDSTIIPVVSFVKTARASMDETPVYVFPLKSYNTKKQNPSNGFSPHLTSSANAVSISELLDACKANADFAGEIFSRNVCETMGIKWKGDKEDVKSRYSVTAPAEQLPRARSGWARETPRRRTANERYAVTNRDIPNMNGQELVTLAIAAQVAMQRHKNGVNPRKADGTLREVAHRETVEKMVKKYHPNATKEELRSMTITVMHDAKMMARDIMADFDKEASDAEILNALSAKMQKRYQKRIREATLKGEMVKGLSARAQEELNRKQEATIAAAVAVETGLDANAVENEYGIDLAETMVGLSDTAEFIKSRNAQMMIAEMSAADQEDGETGKDGETAGETDGATDTGNEKKLTPEEEAKRKQEEEERKKKINERFEQQAKDADKQRKEAKKEAEKRKAEAAAAGETDGATEDGEEGEEDAEGASKPLTPEEAAAREKAREEERQRVREACKELIARAEARAKERKEKLEAANKKRAETIAKKKAEAAAAGETAGETESEGTNAEDESEDGGDAGETNGALDAIELAKVAIDLANPEHVAAFIIELARAKWIAQHNLKKDITDGQLWRDKIALQFLRKTAESIMTKMARSMNHSYGREMSMSEIAKITHAPNFSGVRSRIENAARVIRDRMITDKRKKLVKTVENFIRKNYIRHKEFKNGEEYTKRKCAAETELFMRDVLKVMWYSNAKVEKELERIEIENAELKGEYANGGRDKDQSKAYNRNERMRRALLQYGALIRRTPGEIMDAFTIIQDVKETDDTQKRIEERERRTQAAADILSAYFTNPEVSHVFTDSEHRIGNYFCGHMGLMDRLRDMGRYCKDAKTEEQAKAVLEYLDFMIQRSGDESASERRRHSDAFYKAVERIYHRKYRTVMAEMNTPDARFDKFGIIDDEAGGANKMTKGRAMQLYVSLMQNGEREYKHNIELHKREGQADEIRALLTAEDLQMIKWLGNWYEQNRKQLSAITYDLFGTKVESESANYFPVKMFLEMQGMEKPNVSVFQLFPKSLMPRIRNSRDFDTTADIFQMWMSRMTENAEWKAHAQLGLEVRGIFGRAKLCETIRRNHGRTALAQTQAFMNDILLGKTQSDESGAGVNTFGDEVRGYAALLALGGNVGVTLKQTTSIPAFGFEKGNRELFLQHEGDGADG